jgi:hypothetical protein
MKKMNGHRFFVMWFMAAMVMIWYLWTDPDGGLETLARLQWLAWSVILAGPVYLMRKALMPGDSKAAWNQAMNGNIAAGITWAGMAILTGMLFLAFSGKASATDLPPGAIAHLPQLRAEIDQHWPAAPHRASLAAQVEQETCISLKSARCWNPTTELKTAREYGFGLGQLTVTSRFDNFKAARQLDVSLRDWKWEERYDPAKQLRTMILMDKGNYQRLVMVADPHERLAMTFAAYNGGLGGVLSDRRLCTQISSCDPQRWFDHVEAHSLKQKEKSAGYGQSFFDINRSYVRNIMLVRQARYVAAMRV